MLADGWRSNSRAAKRWLELMRGTSAAREFSDGSELTMDRIRQMTRPALAIFGQYSDCRKTLRSLEANLPNLKKITVPGAGHFHCIFKPGRFVQELGQFIRTAECDQDEKSQKVEYRAT
jgi:pimeloyl-ACP methyl ester carboxylesterase